MQKFSCCKIVHTCVMDSFRGSHRPNFLYDETFHLGISRIQNCISTATYINVMTKFIFKLSFVFFFDLQKYYILIFYSMIRKKIITHSELYFEQRIVYIVLIVYFIARSFLI